MVTRNDVARLAGTSPAVVSYVINNGPKPVSEAARRRVLAAVAELGYRPNAVARSLRARRTWTIGVIASGNTGGTSPFFSQFTRACEEVAWQRGYSVLLGNSAEDPMRAEGYVRRFMEHQVDGLVLMRVPITPERAEEMRGRVPVVTIDHTAPPHFSRLAVDDEEGGYQATRHLVQHGHRRIGYIGGPLDITPVRLRAIGRRRALRESALLPPGPATSPLTPAEPTAADLRADDLIAEGEFSLEGGYDAALRLLSSAERPTALFASIDTQAIGAMRAAADLGLRVPQDVAVVGFDGAREAAYTVPGLTTISQPIAEMARRATETLVAAIEKENEEPLTEIFSATLVTRGSCGCPEPRLHR
ncbi:LacI family DNA-binding transcriptional regulator [Nonomuraea sp. NPDC048882]|uniref:LacI family DNA-binding transcriptional regulator n=1 Tax=unclassified Nonomuraea TaxID=2593643 RepID=UPI0033E58CF4